MSVSAVNTGDPQLVLQRARGRVLEIQTKLHRWARDDPHRRFDDLFNLVTDPAFLLVGWDRVRRNTGARTAGIDGRTARSVLAGEGVEEFLDQLRSQLKDRSFRPVPVRERMIPKSGGGLRRLGIPIVADRVVQASVKLVLEPIFEADFLPCSYGFRPNRRAQDAIAEVHYLTSRPRSYEWVLEGDIAACFDEIDHLALMDRVRGRVADNRVLGVVKAFLKAGVLTEDRRLKETTAGTPQGGILSPLLSNIALGVLDEFIAAAPGGPSASSVDRARRRRHGQPNYRLVRYADDWCLLIKGSKDDAEGLREQIAAVLATMGLRLSTAKTVITHIDEGLDFLGWRIQRHAKRGTQQRYVYTYPARKAVHAITAKVKALRRQVPISEPLQTLLRRVNSTLRGWCGYFRSGVSSATFAYLSHYAWASVWRWLRSKHRRSTWKQLRHQYCAGRWWPSADGQDLFNPTSVSTTRYRYRGTKIPTAWPTTISDTHAA